MVINLVCICSIITLMTIYVLYKCYTNEWNNIYTVFYINNIECKYMGYQSLSSISNRHELRSMVKKSSKIIGIFFLIFGLLMAGVSAYIYQQATLTVTQNIVEVASFTVKNNDLGDINEGQTLVYTSIEVANLGEATTIITTTAPVYLHFDSDVDSLSASYSTYNINVIHNSNPSSTTGTACTMTLGSPDYSSVSLDAVGTWVFDLSIETTADSVDMDTPTTVTVIVGAESN